MDLNLKIIEGVKQFSCLYDNCGDLGDRNHAWLQLAEQLDMNVQVLQIRWHGLLQLYHRDNNFRYAKKMQFVYRNKEKLQEDSWPEFIITDDYFKHYRNEDQEQFIYLETDEEENFKSKQLTQNNDCNDSKGTQESNKHVENKQHDNDTKEVDLTGNESEIEANVKEISPDKINHHDVSNSKTIMEHAKIVTTDVKKSEESVKQTKEKVSEKPPCSIEERCEDVIFGELVSATLRRMDENKKKSIKKEIMNLLFS